MHVYCIYNFLKISLYKISSIRGKFASFVSSFVVPGTSRATVGGAASAAKSSSELKIRGKT